MSQFIKTSFPTPTSFPHSYNLTQNKNVMVCLALFSLLALEIVCLVLFSLIALEIEFKDSLMT